MLDTPPTLLTYPLPEAEYASFENLIIPKPFAQGRFFYNPTDNSVVGEPQDVTDIPWRRRWDPAKASLQAYGARIGSRYQNIWHEIFGSDIWAYNPGFWDEDGMVFRWGIFDDTLWLAYMALNPIGEPTWVAGYSDSYWTISSISSSPSFTSARPQTPDDFSASMSNDPTPGWNPAWGATLDPATSAKSRLFRYWIEFDEKRKASAVPRKDGDRWMNVRCRIVPQNQPPGWVDHVELKVWDPAYPNAQRHRIINGDSGDPCISKMWDGKLYVDGNESTTPYYTQASDVFMQATIHWNPLSPSKAWENSGDSNAFDEPRHAIVAPLYGQAISFNDADPASCYIPCEVAASTTERLVELISELPVWDVNSIPGVQKSAFNRDPFWPGTNGTFTYTDLPVNLSDLGRKTVTLSHSKGSCSQRFYLFFDTHATNHPGTNVLALQIMNGDDRVAISGWENIYYYYLQVTYPTHQYVTCLKDTTEIGMATTHGVTGTTTLVFAHHYSPPPGQPSYAGFCRSSTFFSGMIAHENTHHDQYKSWWPSGYEPLDDYDGDYAPDWWESYIGYEHRDEVVYTMLPEVAWYELTFQYGYPLINDQPDTTRHRVTHGTGDWQSDPDYAIDLDAASQVKWQMYSPPPPDCPNPNNLYQAYYDPTNPLYYFKTLFEYDAHTVQYEAYQSDSKLNKDWANEGYVHSDPVTRAKE